MATASEKVTTAIHAALAAASSSINWFVDRDPMVAPLTEAELPAACLRILREDIQIAADLANDRHTATLQFDCLSGTQSSLSIDAINAETVAVIVEALWADGDATLGGMVEYMEPEFADASEQSAPDVGWAVLQYRVEFLTPRGDFRHVCRADGTII